MVELEYLKEAVEMLKLHMDRIGAYDISIDLNTVKGIVKIKETGANFDLSLIYDMPSDEEAEREAKIAANNAELDELLSAIAPEGD